VEARPAAGDLTAYRAPISAPPHVEEARATAVRGCVHGAESRAGARGRADRPTIPSRGGGAAAGSRGDQEASARAAARNGAQEESRNAAASRGHRGGPGEAWHELARLAALALGVPGKLTGSRRRLRDYLGGLSVVRKLLLGYGAALEDRRLLGARSPILRRVLDAHGGTHFPRFFLSALHKLYKLTLLACGGTGFEDAERDGWVVAAIRPLGHAVELQWVAAERPLNGQEAALLTYAAATARSWLPGVKMLEPSPAQWTAMSQEERDLLWRRLGFDEEGGTLHPLPPGHSFRKSGRSRMRWGTTHCRGGNRSGGSRGIPPSSTRTAGARPRRRSNATRGRRRRSGMQRISRVSCGGAARRASLEASARIRAGGQSCYAAHIV
jgi:hypothetical protein